jgi:peptide deformylase
MPVQKIISKSALSLQPSRTVTDFKDPYVRQTIFDLLETLENQQAELDVHFPREGRGVGLAANQLQYPHEPKSRSDSSPKKDFYPAGFIPYNIYVISIREDRARIEGCKVLKPTVFINAKFTPYINPDRDTENLLDQGLNLLTLDAMDIETPALPPKDTFYDEGCLSVMGFIGSRVPRYKSILVTAFNTLGEEFNLLVDDFSAIVHQHEIDHGEGKEFLNHLKLDSKDLCVALKWANEFNVEKQLSPWVIENKLKCNRDKPDVDALRTWILHEMKVLGISPDMLFLSRVPTLLFNKSQATSPTFFPDTPSPIASLASPTSETYKPAGRNGNTYG